MTLLLWSYVAEFGCKFSDDAALSGLRLQCEVVSLGFVFDLLTVCCPPLQRLVAFLPSRVGCNRMERDLTRDMYRYRNDMIYVSLVRPFGSLLMTNEIDDAR